MRVSKGQYRTIQWQRAINHEAALLHVTGQPAPQPCISCDNGVGPFEGCIVADGITKGACASCHYNSESKRCSFRKGKNPDLTVAISQQKTNKWAVEDNDNDNDDDDDEEQEEEEHSRSTKRRKSQLIHIPCKNKQT